MAFVFDKNEKKNNGNVTYQIFVRIGRQIHSDAGNNDTKYDETKLNGFIVEGDRPEGKSFRNGLSGCDHQVCASGDLRRSLLRWISRPFLTNVSSVAGSGGASICIVNIRQRGRCVVRCRPYRFSVVIFKVGRSSFSVMGSNTMKNILWNVSYEKFPMKHVPSR